MIVMFAVFLVPCLRWPVSFMFLLFVICDCFFFCVCTCCDWCFFVECLCCGVDCLNFVVSCIDEVCCVLFVVYLCVLLM